MNERQPLPWPSRQLHFVTGKGGVGKSTFACALATFFSSKQKSRTLLVQVHAKDSHSMQLKSPPIEEKIQQVDDYLWAVNITPLASLQEYVHLKLRFEKVTHKLFESPIIRAFLRFVPSLAELNMLGKIWFHTQEMLDDSTPKYERIVVDCPATGHGMTFIHTAQIIHQVAPLGPLADETGKMQETITDSNQTATHIITKPQELSVNETLQSIEVFSKKNIAPLAAIWVNQVHRPLFLNAPTETALAHWNKNWPLPEDDKHVQTLSHWHTIGNRRHLKEKNENAQICRLKHHHPSAELFALPLVSSVEESTLLKDITSHMETSIDALRSPVDARFAHHKTDSQTHEK